MVAVDSVRFKHNDMPSLEECLKDPGNKGRKLVVVDGVHSMEGDIADLPNCKRRWPKPELAGWHSQRKVRCSTCRQRPHRTMSRASPTPSA